MCKKEDLSFIYVFSIMGNTSVTNKSRLIYYLDLKPQKIVTALYERAILKMLGEEQRKGSRGTINEKDKRDVEGNSFYY